MSLTTIASRPFAASLPRAQLDASRAVLGGEADERLAVAAPRGEPGEHVGGRLELQLQALAPGLLDLASAGAAGVKSATAAAISSTSQAGNSRSQAACSSAARRRRAARDAGGRRQRDVRGDAASPARRARAPPRASARPMRPEELLPRKRTLSIGSRVPPAVTSTRSPRAAAAAAPSPDRRRDAAARAPPRRRPAAARGSARRPMPCSPLRGQPARAGLDDRARRARAAAQVGLRGRVLVHAVVHRRRDHAAGSAAASAQLRQQVVGQARARAWRSCSPRPARSGTRRRWRRAPGG